MCYLLIYYSRSVYIQGKMSMSTHSYVHAWAENIMTVNGKENNEQQQQQRTHFLLPLMNYRRTRRVKK